jgi:putative salt-induced outer membrane protein YdiY
MRSPAEQAAYEKSLHPGWEEGWAGGANIGFAFTAGNSETKNLNIGFNATRTGAHDKLLLYETSIYSSTSKLAQQPIPTQTTANSNNGGLRYDHDFTPRVFGFGAGDFFNNALQDLDLRYILGGGIGLHAIKTPNTTLDLLAGINYTHENFSGLVEPNPLPPRSLITTLIALRP